MPPRVLATTAAGRRNKLVLLAAAFVCLYFAAAQPLGAAGSADRSVCDTCACTPDNVAPVAVNCTCSKTKLLIIRDKDVPSLSSVRDLTLAGCGFVSLPSSGLVASKWLARVTVRDIKQFHYTVGLFPALESLSVEDVEVLVLDGFGPANRTLRHLTLRRVAEVRLAKGSVTAAAPLRRVLFDRVNADEIESGTLDMAFVGDGDNGQAAADGFTVVDSTIKSMASRAVTVRTGAVRILNSTLDYMASGALVVDDGKGGVTLSGNRLGDLVGDSVSVSGSDGDVRVDGNEFRDLPADMQLLKSAERPVEFRDNAVANVDLGPFLFDVGAAVRVAGNRFACDCDPRRTSVLKIDQVFPGLLPGADGRLSRLLAENYCQRPDNATLADYRDLLVAGVACEGANLTTGRPRAPSQTPSDAADRPGNEASVRRAAAVLVVAAVVTVASTVYR